MSRAYIARDGQAEDPETSFILYLSDPHTMKLNPVARMDEQDLTSLAASIMEFMPSIIRSNK